MSLGITSATRAIWREHRDYVIRFGSRYLSERERTFIAEVDSRLARGEDLAFGDSLTLSRLHAELERRIG